MKCAFHPEVDAVGVCVGCGKGVCAECKTELGGKIYCPNCAEEIFAERKKRSGLLTAGGILSIIGGAFNLINGIAIMSSFPFLASFPSDSFSTDAFPQAFSSAFIGITIWFFVFGGVAVVGGIHALVRKRWGLSLAGGICALLTPSFIFGLLAVIFVAIRKKEFEQSPG